MCAIAIFLGWYCDMPTLWGRERETVAKDMERVEAHYKGQILQTDKVYRWHPERTLVDCGCGRTLITNGFTTSCAECGSEYTVAFRCD